MRLYHGSNVSFDAVDLERCRPNKDFGRGFYLTPDREGAVKMAIRTVRRFGGSPFVMTFDLDESKLAGVAVRRFAVPDEDWALFVMANRRPQMQATDHNRENRYGMVSGPIANDDLALLFRQFERGLVSVEMLVREMKFKQLTVQFSFHTKTALAALSFMEAEDVR